MRYQPIYFRRTDTVIPLRPIRPGEIIPIEDINDAFNFLELRIVPDPDHQSSLDYLKGV
jgi:hypothetical protein